MKYFKTLTVPAYNFNSLYSHTTSWIYAQADFFSKPTENRVHYWYTWIIDGVETPIKTNYISSPSETRNRISTNLFVKNSITTAQLKIWEEDPKLNPQAEFITSNEQTNIKVLPWLSIPKIDCELQIKKDSSSLWVRSFDWELYYSVENLKIFDFESGFVLYDGAYKTTLNTTPLELTKPAKGVALSTIVSEWTLTDLSNNETLKTSSVCSMFPRFDQGEYSVITDFMPFRTHDGKKITKYPIFTNSNPNIYIDLDVHKSAVIGRNFEETIPGAMFENRGNASIDYHNDRSGDRISGDAYLDIGYSSVSMRSQSMDSRMSNLNTVQNGGELINGDMITPKLTIGNDQNIIEKPKLKTELCVINTRELNELKFVSMPPIDMTKPFYEIETFKSENDFLPFGQINSSFGSGEPLEFTTNKIKLNLSEVSYPNDLYINISNPILWYPDINTIDILNDSQMSGEARIMPLVTSTKESVSINSNQSAIAGQPLTLYATVENLIEINIGTNHFVWKKDGVVIPGKIASFIEFDSISPDDNGSYTVEYTILPRGIQADDSAIKMVSQFAFDINVTSENPLTMVVSADPKDIVIDAPLTIEGTITIANNTISKSELYKDNVKIKEFALTELNPKLEIAEAAETDAGVYQFRVVYMDGPVQRVYTSEAIPVIYDGRSPIDFSVDITVPTVNDGDQATLVGKINITNAPAGITYIYQWHRGVEGAIVGEDDKDLVIDQATANDIGEYWLSVLAKAPDRASTLKASPHKNLIVRQDVQLRFNIVAEHNIVADGKPAKLTMSYSANQQVSPTWDWYANGEKIADSKDKSTIEHIGFGDVIYYVLGKPLDETAIPLESQSNIVFVKGVVAVENLTLNIDGPAEAGLGERVLFEALISETNHNSYSNDLNRDDYSYEWYKGATKIGSGKEIRIYAAADAGGDYTYKIISKVDPTISKTSPIHKFTIKEETQVSVTLPPTKSLKVGEKLEIIPTITPADDVDTKFQWMKNGNVLQGKTTRSFVIESTVKGDSGVYTLSVTNQSTPTISTPCVVTVRDEVTPPDPKPIGDWYIHDLNPGRNHGFTWMGWWVLDEIQQAINDDFDWLGDPTNPRFKYPTVLKALADNRNVWDDIEIQESRNGYILLLSQLEVVGI